MSWGRLPDNPFVGLRPFESHESLLFFGRHDQGVELLEQLHQARFLAVVGSSGSGKSSLVRAGLVPKLQAGFLVDDRDVWRVATMKPGDAPLGNLAAALAAELAVPEGEGGGFADEIRERGVTVILERAGAALSGDANLLLLVDQFEELFRFGLHTAGGARGEEAAHFVSILLELAAQREAPIYVVMTMRSDFLGDCDAFLGLPEAMNRGQYLVPRLTRRQRREAIEGPVKLYRAEIAPRLVDRLLNETIDARDDLPVLQHALMRTWETWATGRAGPIDVEHYETVGTIAWALSQHAEEAMEGLSENEVELARRIFQALTESDPGNRRIRRPARLDEIELITGADRQAVLRIVDRFRSDGRSFLVVSNEDDARGATVDISHESLIRQWSRLAEWVDEEAESARTFRRLAEDTALYRLKKGELYHGAALQVAEQWEKNQKPTSAWAARYGYDLVPVLGFLAVSRKAEEGRAREAEERRRRELRRVRLVAAVLGIAFVITLALGLWAVRQKRIASEERTAAELAEERANKAKEKEEVAKEAAIREGERATLGQQKAESERKRAEGLAERAEAEAERARRALLLAEERRRQVLARQLERSSAESYQEGNLEAGALLALESLAASPTDLGIEALISSIEMLLRPPAEFVRFPAERNPKLFGVDPSGRWLAFVILTKPAQPASKLERVENLVLVDLSGATEPRRIEIGMVRLTTTLSILVVSPDGHWLAAGSHKAGHVWDTRTLQPVRQLWAAPPADAPYSPTLGPAPPANQVDPPDAGHPHWLSQALRDRTEDLQGTLAFSPDGRVLYLATGDDALHRFETAGWTELPPLRSDQKAVLSVTVTADGEILATGSAFGAALWSIRSGEPLATYHHRRDHRDGLSGLSISGDRKLVAARLSTGGVLVLRCPDLEPGRVAEMDPVAEWPHDGRRFDQVELSPDGRLMLVRQRSQVQLLDLEGPSGTVAPDARTLGKRWRSQVLNVLHGARHLAVQGDRFAVVFHHEVGLWNWRHNEGEAKFIPRPSGLAALSFSADGRFLFSLSEDGNIAIHDGDTLAPVPFDYDDPPARALQMSPDGKWMAVAGASSLQLLEIGSWRQVVPAIALEAEVHPRFAFTENSRHLVAWLGPEVLVVEPERATVSPPLVHDLSEVGSIRLSPEERWLEVHQPARVNRGGEILQKQRTRVWELGSGREVATEAIELPEASTWTTVTPPEFPQLWTHRENERWRVASGKRAAVTGILAHPRRPEDLRLEACARLSGNLSKTGWKEHLLNEPYRETCTSWRLHESAPANE